VSQVAGPTPAELLSVWERGSGQDPVRRALTLLVAFHDGPARAAPRLDIGTRDVLLAGLLAGMIGDHMPGSTDCLGCGELLDLTIDIRAVAELPVIDAGAWTSVKVGEQMVRYRLPTSEDLLAVTGLPPLQAHADLLRSCLGLGPDEVPDPGVEAAVDAAMEAFAPAGAIDLIVRCPECGLQSAVPLDVPALLWSKVESEASGLLRDVHDLAVSYGWTETDVLALSPQRRASYLAMVG
jgi:hypothetical protein